ncbi:MAG: hypothetical protein IJA78_04675 [Clostridia bacterium]|nr:hypothetical protein [Clostridia bacterium]
MKKKLLALLLAVMMIVTVFPVSIFAADAATQNETDPGAVIAVDDSLEAPAPAEDDYFQLVNKVGAHLGYFKTIEEADAAWDDGYTIRLLKDYELTEAWNVGSSRAKVFESNPAEGKSDDPLNDATFDGQGYKLIANGFTAIEIGVDAYWDCFTVKNLIVVSSALALDINGGTVGQSGVIFENCELYGDNAYYLFDSAFYADAEETPAPAGNCAVLGHTDNARISFTGANTVVASWGGPAVRTDSGPIELVDGLYYSHTGEVTIYNARPKSTTSSNVVALHTISIHGGTYINRTKTVVATRYGTGVSILGGTFLQTGENAVADTALSAISVGMYDMSAAANQNGIMYVIGGEFWVAEKSGCTSTPVVMDAGFSALFLLGNPAFYGPTAWTLSGTTGVLVDGVRVGDYNVLNAIAATAETKTYNKGFINVSIAAAYKQTVSMADSTAGAEGLIYNKEGTLISGVNLDGTGNGYDLVFTAGAAYAAKAQNALNQLRFSLTYIPAYGRMDLQANITPGAQVKDLMLGAAGGAPIIVSGQGQYGFSLSGSYPLTLAYGGNLILKDMTIAAAKTGVNLDAKGVQLKLTLDNVDMSVNGTAFLINTGDAEVNLINGTTVTMATAAIAFQLRGYARINVKDSSIVNGNKAIFHKSPDRRDIALANEAGYLDWIDNDVVLTLDNATLTVTGGMELFFSGKQQSNQSTKCEAEQSEHRTTLTAKNGTTLNYGEESLVIDTAVTVQNAAKTESVTVENATYAAGYMKDGFTMQLGENANYFAGVSLYLDSPAAAWTLDGNGATLYGGTGGFEAQPTSGIGALEVTGNYSDVTVENLTIESTSYGFATGPDANKAVSALNLNNVTVNAVSLGRVTGANNLVNIIGENTVMTASKNNNVFEVGGALAIYNGEFNTPVDALAEGAEPTAVFFAVKNPTVTDARKTTTLLTVYGGTFNAGPAVKSMIQTSNGANAVVLGGDFNFAAAGEYSMLQPAVENYGYLEIQGGNFYAPNATAPIYAPATPEKAYAIFAGGTFYGQAEETNLVNNPVITTDDEGNEITFATSTGRNYDALYYGTRIDEVYGVTTENDVDGYAFVTTIAREDAATEEAADLAVTDGQGNTRYYHADEIELAFSAVGDGGEIVLLQETVEVIITNTETNFYSNPNYTFGIETETFNHFVEYAIVGADLGEDVKATLVIEFDFELVDEVDPETSEVTGKKEGSYFALNVLGGNVTFENLDFLATSSWIYEGQEEYYTFRALADSNIATGVVMNIKNTTVLADSYSTLKLFSKNAELNLLEGACISHMGGATKVGGSVEIGGNDSTVNVYDGAWIGRESFDDSTVYTTYGIGLTGDRNVVNIYGGNVYGDSTDAESHAAIYIASTAQNSEINVWNGVLNARRGVLDLGTETVANVLGGTFATYILFEENGDNAVINIGEKDSDAAPTCADVALGFVFNGGEKSTFNVWAGTYEFSSRAFFLKLGDAHTVNVWGGSFTAPDIFRASTETKDGTVLTPTNSTVNAYAGTYSATTSMITAYGGGNTYNIGVMGENSVTFTGASTYPFVFNGGTEDIINVYSGTYTAANYTVWVNRGTSATFNLYGGSLVSNGNAAIRTEANANKCTVNIWDGTLQANRIFYEAGVSTTVNMYAGNYKATSALIEANGGSGANYNIGVKGDDALLTQTGTSSYPFVFNGGSNHTITLNAGKHTGTHKSYGAAWIRKGSGHTLNVNGGTLLHTETTNRMAAILTQVAATINITGGLVEGYQGIRTTGGAATVTISGGEIKSHADNTIQDGIGSTFTITGGTLTADTANLGRADKNGYVFALTSASKLTMTGGTASAYNNLGYSAAASTWVFGGDAVLNGVNGITFAPASGITASIKISGNAAFHVTGASSNAIGVTNSPVGTLNVEISGGKLHAGSNTVSIGKALASLSVDISGGTLISDTGVSFLTTHTAATISITGGAFLTKNDNQFVTIPASADLTKITLSGIYAGGTTMTHGGKAPKVTYESAEYFMWAYGAATDAAYAGVMTNGAQIRMVESSNGLRFVTTFRKATVDALNALGEVTYGTLIVPLDYLIATGGIFTHEALTAAGLESADIVADNGMIVDANGNVTVRAALVNIKTENYARGFAAISYAKVGDTYYYGTFESLYNARSIEQVATMALNDVYFVVGALNGKLYTYESVVEGINGYSRYNAAQQEILAAYAGLELKTEE